MMRRHDVKVLRRRRAAVARNGLARARVADPAVAAVASGARDTRPGAGWRDLDLEP